MELQDQAVNLALQGCKKSNFRPDKAGKGGNDRDKVDEPGRPGRKTRAISNSSSERSSLAVKREVDKGG